MEQSSTKSPRGFEDQWDGKKKFRLGTTLPEAYKKWAERLESRDVAKTIGALLDRYALEVVPTKAVRTQVENQRAIRNLRGVFGAAPLNWIRPQHIYQYADRHKATPVAANRAIEDSGLAGCLFRFMPGDVDSVCTRKGEGYIDEKKGTASGWDSVWQRFMTRVMAETTISDRFTEHDLRAKCVSDAETLEQARALLSHV